MWSFYGPAIAKSIRKKFDNQSFLLPDRSLFTAPQFQRPQATNSLLAEPEPSLILARSVLSMQGLNSESK